MAKNPISMLIDAIGDALGTSHYKEDLKIAQKHAGLTFDRDNYERYRYKKTLLSRYSDTGIKRFYNRDYSDYVARISISFSINSFLMHSGFIHTKEMIDAIPPDIKRDNYEERNIQVLYKVAELHQRGVPLPDSENWGRILEM